MGFSNNPHLLCRPIAHLIAYTQKYRTVGTQSVLPAFTPVVGCRQLQVLVLTTKARVKTQLAAHLRRLQRHMGRRGAGLLDGQSNIDHSAAAEVELEAIEAPPTPARENAVMSFRVVKISTLEERLRTTSELEVLNLLTTTEELSEMVSGLSASKVRCALISYRQERGGGGEYDHLTLDGAALRGAISAAKGELGAEALWLDAWCYRFNGEYNHDDFCRTLEAVLSGIFAVVWLPRTKHASTGECEWHRFKPAPLALLAFHHVNECRSLLKTVLLNTSSVRSVPVVVHL